MGRPPAFRSIRRKRRGVGSPQPKVAGQLPKASTVITARFPLPVIDTNRTNNENRITSELAIRKMMTMKEYGSADLIETNWALTPLIGQKIAAVIIFGGSIEYFLEQAIWRLKKIEPKGIRPETDAKMITDLIAMLRTFAMTLPTGNERELLETWCEAAH